MRRRPLPVRSATAFAPAAITNFFEISYGPSGLATGATGGGYILSRGTLSKATYEPGPEQGLLISVNGDVDFPARTTRRAVELLTSEVLRETGVLRIEQTVETPIGSGFGASAASATSGVFAAARAAGLSLSKGELALFAHRAELLEQTGLGTVSVVFDAVGAGAITVPGEPGRSKFVAIPVPEGVRLVTAFVGPYEKKDALSSSSMRERINLLGRRALQGFLADPSLDSLGEQGELYSRDLGLESPEVKKLIALAKSAGASHASQNMIGYSVHCVVDSDSSARVASALRLPNVRVDTFDVGSRKAGVLEPSRR